MFTTNPTYVNHTIPTHKCSDTNISTSVDHSNEQTHAHVSPFRNRLEFSRFRLQPDNRISTRTKGMRMFSNMTLYQCACSAGSAAQTYHYIRVLFTVQSRKLSVQSHNSISTCQINFLDVYDPHVHVGRQAV